MVSSSLHRGSLSLSLELSRTSIYSSHSYTSLDSLLPSQKPQTKRVHYSTTPPLTPQRPRNLNTSNQNLRVARGQAPRRMATNGSQAVGMEQKKSYGIGGAGNIRRPSEVIYPQRRNSDGSRRRSSVWSSISTSPGTSPPRRTLFGLFGRKGSGSGSGSEETGVYSRVEGRKVEGGDGEMAGKKNAEAE